MRKDLCGKQIRKRNSGEVYIKKGSAAGADDYFTKSFSPMELIRTVEETLG